jgi:hypothetical protein
MKYFKITDLRTGDSFYISSTRLGETVRALAAALNLNNSKHHEIKEVTYNEFYNETEKVFTDSEDYE